MTSYSDEAGHPLTPEDALRQLADAAHDILLETAARYGATITTPELARRVLAKAGITTDAQVSQWLARVVTLVIHRCHATREPALTSLVVHPREGTVGVLYAEVLRVAGKPPMTNASAREKHAAAARLECYKRYARDVPANAVPREARVLGAPKRERPTRRTPEPTRPDVSLYRICPKCFLETRADGECLNCL